MKGQRGLTSKTEMEMVIPNIVNACIRNNLRFVYYLAHRYLGPITDTTEEPSINTSQKLTENTTEEQSSDSTYQPATTNEVPTITKNTTEEQSSDTTDQPAITNEVLTTDNNEEPLISTQDSKKQKRTTKFG
ncbi:hypothetical protein Avbf_19028 [Armadillidium vulgare]|nr:hypothetical protein Avbf_19028 [Armadillidium vulgare]